MIQGPSTRRRFDACAPTRSTQPQPIGFAFEDRQHARIAEAGPPKGGLAAEVGAAPTHGARAGTAIGTFQRRPDGTAWQDSGRPASAESVANRGAVVAAAGGQRS